MSEITRRSRAELSPVGGDDGGAASNDRSTRSPTSLRPLPYEVWQTVFDELASMILSRDMRSLRLVDRLFYELANPWSFRLLQIHPWASEEQQAGEASDLNLKADWLSTAMPFPTAAMPFPTAARFLYAISIELSQPKPEPTPPTSTSLIGTPSLLTPKTSPASPTIALPPSTPLPSLRHLRIKFPFLGYDNSVPSTNVSPLVPLLIPLLHPLTTANPHLKSLTLHHIPSTPQDLSPSVRHAFRTAFSRVEYLSITFGGRPLGSSVRPPVPSPGETLTDDRADGAPWQLYFAYLARANLRVLHLGLSYPDIAWPCPRDGSGLAGTGEEGEREFGAVFPRLETLVVRANRVDVRGWAWFLRAHWATMKWVAFQGCTSTQMGYSWAKFIETVRDGRCDLIVLELAGVAYWPTRRRAVMEDYKVLDGLERGLERGRNPFRDRGDLRSLADFLELGAYWFDAKCGPDVAWDPIGDVLERKVREEGDLEEILSWKAQRDYDFEFGHDSD